MLGAIEISDDGNMLGGLGDTTTSEKGWITFEAVLGSMASVTMKL